MRPVAIFRHNLFRLSEPFITQQAQPLTRHAPFYLGRLRFGPAPEGARSLAIADLPWPWPQLGWNMLTRDPSAYLRLLKGHAPALIHAHFGIEGVHALPLARRLKVPLVTSFHGFDATLSTAALLRSPAWMHYPLFRHQLAREGNLFLAASSFIRERLLAMGFPEARTKVHYIGVDCAAIQPRDPALETQTIVHVARLVPVKGTETLIRAFAQMKRRDAGLTIIGDGPLRKRLTDLAQSLGVASRVRFLGGLPHAEVLAHIAQASMLVLPSVRAADGRVEGLGMVLLEAAASGVPAIGAAIGGIPEGVRDGETGFLVPPRDPAALAARMDALLDDAPLRRRMGAAARALAETRFDLRHQTSLLEDHYDSLL